MSDSPPSSPTSEGRQFPVMQGKSKIAGPPRVPWSVAEKAYSVYSARYGKHQSLERLAERGGWYVEELDDYHPAWREEAGEIAALRASLTEAQAEIERLTSERREAISQLFIKDQQRAAAVAEIERLKREVSRLDGQCFGFQMVITKLRQKLHSGGAQ